MLEAGASIYERTNDGNIALYIAAEMGNLKIVEILLESEESINDRTNDAMAVFDDAVNKDNIIIVENLLSLGEYIDPKSIFYNIWWHFTVSARINQEVKLYQSNPIEYILTHNGQAKLATISFENLKEQPGFVQYIPIIEAIEECLQNHITDSNIDLNALCGTGILANDEF